MSEITRLTGKLTIKFNFHNKKTKPGQFQALLHRYGEAIW